jgi:hypothetical protein
MIAVKQAWVFKVANYGQWDWYPMWQGEWVREFLSEVDINIFKEKVSACRAITEAEIEAIPDENWSTEYPWLSRDAGSDILKYIMEDRSVLKMAEDCLTPNMWIEWSYLIDLDTMTFNVYRWTILSDGKYERAPRWPYPISSVYKPFKPMHSYSLLDIPTQDEWLKKYNKY